MSRIVAILTCLHCQFRGVGQGVKHALLHLWYSLSQPYRDRCDKIIKRRITKWKDIIYISECEIRGYLTFAFLEKQMFQVWLIRIKEQARQKRSTLCTRGNTDCLFQNTSINHSKICYQSQTRSFWWYWFQRTLGRFKCCFHQIRFTRS